MISWGAMLLVLGIGSFILPLTGMQFRLMEPLKDAQPVAGIVVSGLGVLLIVLGSIRTGGKRAQQTPSRWPLKPPNLPPPQLTALPGSMQMDHCLRCGHPLWAGDVVCRTCRLPASFGRPPQPQPVTAMPPAPPVALRCPNPACGQIGRPGRKFCAACGTRL